MAITRKHHITFEQTGVELSSLIVESLKAPSYPVDLQESPTVQNNLPKIQKCNNIVVDVIFYMKCELETHTSIHHQLLYVGLLHPHPNFPYINIYKRKYNTHSILIP